MLAGATGVAVGQDEVYLCVCTLRHKSIEANDVLMRGVRFRCAGKNILGSGQAHVLKLPCSARDGDAGDREEQHAHHHSVGEFAPAIEGIVKKGKLSAGWVSKRENLGR